MQRKSQGDIKYFVIMGDSLSDRGEFLRDRLLLGVLPLGILMGYQSTSPQGRFTNGFAYDDDFAAYVAGRLVASNIESSQHLDQTDFVDGLLDKDPKIDPAVHHAYSLANDRLIRYNGRDFMRSYAQAGLTAHDYHKERTWRLSLFTYRKIVASLADKRAELLRDDKASGISDLKKAETLVMELSGGNDFITVNTLPNDEIVQKTLHARVSNVEELIQSGYKNFVLMGLPDVSLTPRFQHLSEKEREIAAKYCHEFNDKLHAACNQLMLAYPGVTVRYYDVASVLSAAYKHPEDYGFDADKLSTPYVNSKDFSNDGGVSHAPGYMFWDDIHPTAQMHALIAQNFYEKFSKIFTFSAPEPDYTSTAQCMYEKFIDEYKARLKGDEGGWLGRWRKSELFHKLHGIKFIDGRDYFEALSKIVEHGISDTPDGYRTFDVLKKLGWVDDHKNINTEIPVLAAIQHAISPQENQGKNFKL